MRLHRHAGDPVHLRLEPHHVGGAPERGLGGGRIPGVGIDADVRGPLLPHERRAGGQRVGGRGHRGQRLVVDDDELGAISRRLGRVRDHHRDRFADHAHPVLGQRRMRRDEDRRAVAVRETKLVRVRRDRRVGDRFEAVVGGIFTGEHGDHPRRLHGVGGLDAAEARVGVGRPHEAGVDLTRQGEVVAVASLARDEAPVLLARNGLADALRRRGGERPDERMHRAGQYSAGATGHAARERMPGLRAWRDVL